MMNDERTNKRLTHEIDEYANKKTIERSSKRASERMNKRTSKRENKRISKRAIERTTFDQGFTGSGHTP